MVVMVGLVGARQDEGLNYAELGEMVDWCGDEFENKDDFGKFNHFD